MATTVSKQYKLATDNGMLSSKYSEQQFVELLQDTNRRKAYYDFVKKKNPDFYSNNFETFSRNVDLMLAGYTPPTPTNMEQAESISPASASVTQTATPPKEEKKGGFWQSLALGAMAGNNTDAAAHKVSQVLDVQRAQNEVERAERERMNNAQLPVTDNDRQRDKDLQQLNERINRDAMARNEYAQQWLPEDVKKQVQAGREENIEGLKQVRDELQNQRKSYMNEPKTVEEARESWTTAWMENTEEGQLALVERDAAIENMTQQYLRAFSNSQTHADIYNDVQKRFEKGELTEKEANVELNTRLNKAFEEQYGELMQEGKDQLDNAFAMQAYKADNGWLARQEERIREQTTAKELDDKYKELNSAIGKAIEKNRAMGVINSRDMVIGGATELDMLPPELQAALQLYQEAETRLYDTKKGEGNFWTFGKEIARHSKNKFRDLATFGVSSIVDAAVQAKVLKKIADAGAYDVPEKVLDENEMILYDAIVTQLAVETVRKFNTAYGAAAGQMTAEMLPFIRDIMVGKGLLSGATSAVEKSLLRGIAKRIGNGAWGKLLANAGKTGINLAESAIISAVSPMTIQKTLQEEAKIDPRTLQLTDKGWTVGKINTMGGGRAYLKAVNEQLPEYFTETGGMTQFFTGMLKATKLGRYISNSTFGQLLNAFENTHAGKLLKTTAYNGIWEEFGEELENTFYQAVKAAARADKGEGAEAFKNTYEEFFSKDSMLPMLLSFSLPAILGGSVGAIEAMGINKEYDKAHDLLMHRLQMMGYESKEDREDLLNSIIDKVYNADILIGSGEGRALKDYPAAIREATAEIIDKKYGGSIDSDAAKDSFVMLYASLENYIYADQKLSALQAAHAKKQRQVQGLMRDVRETEQRIADNTHTNGMMYHVTTKGSNGVKGYIVSGNVSLNDYNNGMPTITNRDVVTVKMEDGSVWQGVAADLDMVDVPQSAETISMIERRRLTAKMNNLDRFKVGDVIYITENGQPVDGHSSRVADVTDTGIVTDIIGPDGKPNQTEIPHNVAADRLSTISDLLLQDEGKPYKVLMNSDGTGDPIVLQERKPGVWTDVVMESQGQDVTYSQEKVDDMVANGFFTTYEGDSLFEGDVLEKISGRPQPSAPTTDDVASGTGVVSEEAGEMEQPIEQPAAPAAPSKYPTTQEGKLDWGQMDVPTATEAAIEKFGDKNTAKEYAELQIAQAKKAVAAANKKKATSTDADEFVAQKNAIRQEQQAAQAELSKWENVLLGIANYKTAEEQAAAEEQAVEENVGKTDKYQLSDELDDNGRQFVISPSGDIVFGEITDETSLAAAPILLSEGMITNPKTNDGYGLVHIEARHGDQIRNAGYPSVLEFIEQVAKNYEVIKEGKDRQGNQTYLLQLSDKHNNTLIVELSNDGSYWNINTAGIFKNSYGKNRKEVYNRHTTDKQSAENVEESQKVEQSGTTTSSSMNSPTPDNTAVFADEGTKNVPATQEKTQKSVEEQQKIGKTDFSPEEKLAAAEAETDTNPTEAQKKAENYKQGHVTLWGLPFTIENPKGSMRRGTDANGKQWEQVMNNTYGKIRRTEGVDGDHIDVFFGPNLQSDKVFVVDQLNVDTKEFDEHKVMLGFDSMEEAQAAYLSNYEKGWQGMGPVTETTMDEFKKWIDSSHRKTKPFNEYKSVKQEGASSGVTTPVQKSGKGVEKAIENIEKQIQLEQKYRGEEKDASHPTVVNIAEVENAIKILSIEELEELGQAIPNIFSYDKNDEQYKGVDMEGLREDIELFIKWAKESIQSSSVTNRETTERTPRDNADTTPAQKSVSSGKKASNKTEKTQGSVQNSAQLEQKSVETEQKNAESNEKTQNVEKNTQEAAMRFAKAEADMQEFASKLGAQGVHLISNKEQLPNEEGAAYRAIRNGANVMGWYNPKTNQVYIYLPNANNLQEVYKTLLHEFVAHKGLRDMLGKEKFDQLCHEVWDMMSEQDKLQYALYVKNNTAVGSKAMQELMDGMTEEEKAALLSDTKLQLAAADEYMAHFAETGVSEQDRSIWQRIVDAVRDLLRKAGINLRLTDADIARLLYESSSRLSSDMTMRERSLLIAKNNKVVENIGNLDLKARLNDDVMFKLGTQVADMGDNTLVGLHNLSATKLRKAIKQGGLANPSAAVIDIAKQDHEQYGEISLVMPSSLVDSVTGQNAGTYTGDIWSPTYPYIERKMNSKGTDKYYETINKVFENAPVGIKNRIQLTFVNMLDNQGDPDNLAYWYMMENGITPTDVIINSGISDDIKQRFEPLRDKHFVSDMNAEERGLLLSLAAELEGKTTEDLLQAAQEAKARYEAVLENEKASGFSKRIATEAIDEIDTYGVRFNLLSETLRKINEAIDKDGGVDVNASIGAAVNYVQENGLKDDFDSWLDNLDNRFGIEEVIFDGYNRNGDRKYIKHTLENASRIMNKQPIQNASSHGGLSATRGQLVERMSTLAQIRANKHRLAVINEYEYEQWKAMQDEWFNKIINPLSNMQQIDSNHFINMDIAEQRLLEAIMKKDPIAHLNREYGYSIAKDSEFAKSLKDLMQRLKELPSKYFETKFKRPVYLNEFVSAVVPQNLPQDLKDGLANAGVELYEYDEAQDGSRREATLQATESDDVRFRVGYDPMKDKTLNRTAAREMAEIKASAERNGTYLKAPNGADTNLTPRQWLQVRTQAFKEWFGDWESKFRIAKLRDSKPIIATGNEYEGKYELNRDSAEKYILKSLRGAYVNKDTGSVINISRRGAEKVVRHDNDNDMHFKSIALIPQMIENAIYMGELPNEKGINGFDTYRYYMVGLNINGEDYTAKLVIGYIGRENYYDHALTQIEKGKLLNDIDLVKARFDTKEFDFERKDTKLFQILQINLEKSENFSQIVDENGEPMVVYHATPYEFTEFDTKYSGRNTGDAWLGHGMYFSTHESTYYGKNIMPVFLNIRKPADISGNKWQEFFNAHTEDFTVGYKGLTYKDFLEDTKGNYDYLGLLDKYGLTRYLPEREPKAYDVRSQLRRVFDKYGFDGVIADGAMFGLDFVAYEPNQIKSATENVGTFDNSSDDIRFRISNENQRIFVSNAEKAVEGIKQDKATPQQWLAMLEKNGGIKAGEDKWLGLSEWLKEQDKKSITKQEILDFISENQIQIEEVTYSAEPKDKVFEEYKNEYRGYYFEAQDNGAESPQDVAWERMIEEHGEDFGLGFWAYGSELQVEEDSDYTNWEYENKTNERPINETRLDYTTKGLDNKREIALTVPTIESWNEGDEVHFGDAGGGRAVAWVRFGETSIPNENNPRTKEYLDAEEERKNFSRKMMAKYGLTYTERDMSRDELQQDLEITKRISRLKYAQEKIKVLVIDEIQSKRHQEGREKGYKDEIVSKEYEIKVNEAKVASKAYWAFKNSKDKEYGYDLWYLSGENIEKYGTPDFDYSKVKKEDIAKYKELKFNRDKADEAIEEYRNEYLKNSQKIPDAPFDKNWHELAMKRMLRFAAENGYDYVAWTTGAQQAERYNLGKQFDSIEREDNPSINGRRFALNGANYFTFVVNEDGIVTESDMSEIQGKPLADAVGKDLAIRMMSLEDGDAIEGADLRIGGEGMKGFYDKMLPSFVSKYTKKWGAKVQDINLPNLEESAQTMHAVNVTESMKEDVMAGQVMFRISSDKNDVQNVATEIWNKYQYDGELESMRDVAEYAEEHMPKNAQTQALFDAIDAYRIEAEEDRMYYGMRGDLEPFEDAIMDEVERLMNATSQSKLTESEQLTFDALQEVAADAGLDVVEVSEEDAQKVFENNEEPIRTPDGKILGYAQGGTIYLTKAGMTPETVVHEYTHVWAKAMQRNNRAGWENIIEIFKQSPLWDVVVNDPNYEGRLTTDDAICSEVLARFSGKRGAEQLDEVAKEFIAKEREQGGNLGAARVRKFINRAKQAISSFWKWVGKNLFEITKFDSMEDVADRVLYDLLNATELGKLDTLADVAEFAWDTPEQKEMMDKWNEKNPKPNYDDYPTAEEWIEAFRAHTERKVAYAKALREERKKEIARIMLERAIERAKNADPITEPKGALTMIRPQRMKDETAYEYSQRLKAYYNSLGDVESSRWYQTVMKMFHKDWIVTRYVDRGKPLWRFFDEAIKKGAKITDQSYAYDQIFLSRGRIQYEIEKFNRNQLENLTIAMRDIIDSKLLNGINLVWQNMDIHNTGFSKNGEKLTPRDIIALYAQAKDCQEAIEKGLPDRGAAGFLKNVGVSHTEIINMVESKVPKIMIDNLWSAIRGATHFVLEYEKNAGFIDSKQFEENQRDYYVPERGWREQAMSSLQFTYGTNTGKTQEPNSAFNAALVKARGRQSLADDPFNYIASIAYSAIMQVEANKIGQSMLKFCLDNLEWGAKHNAFRMRQIVLMNKFDSEGKIMKDENGMPMLEERYSEPSAEDKAHDAKIHAEIKNVKKSLGKHRNALTKELEEHGESAYTEQLKREIEKEEAQIAYLQDTLRIATSVSNSAIIQQSTERKKQHCVYVIQDGKRYQIEFQDPVVANVFNKTNRVVIRSFLDEARDNIGAAVMDIAQAIYERAKIAYEDGNISEQELKKAEQRYKRLEIFADKIYTPLSMMKDATNIYAGLLTQYNPVFALGNAARDIGFAIDHISIAYPELKKDFKKAVLSKELRQAVWQHAVNDKLRDRTFFTEDKYGKWLEEFFETGAATGYAYLPELRDIQRDLNKALKNDKMHEKIETVKGAFSLFTEFSENFTRFATYAAARENGWTATKAAVLAKNITTNFDKRGEIPLPMCFAFLRASVNALSINWLMFKKAPKRFIYACLIHTVLGMVNQLLNPNDPDDELWISDYVRENNYTIGKVRIPVAHFFRAFHAIGVNMAMLMQGTKTGAKAFYDMRMAVYRECLPSPFNIPGAITEWDYGTNSKKYEGIGLLQNFAPSILSPITDIMVNRDFMGRAINKQTYPWNENTKDIFLAKDKTHVMYKDLAEGVYELAGGDMSVKNKLDDDWLADTFNWSASSVEHFVEGYALGPFAMVGAMLKVIYNATQGTWPTLNDGMILRKFYSSYSAESAYNQLYWELNAAVDSYGDLVDEYKTGNKSKYQKEKQSEKYQVYTAAKRNKLLKKRPKENPTTEDVKELMKLRDQWVQAE